MRMLPLDYKRGAALLFMALAVAVVTALFVSGAETRSARAQTPSMDSVVVIGEDHACALFTDGVIRCISENDEFGQAGGAPSDGRFIAISSGPDHICAIEESGDVQCWGRDDVGQATPPDTGGFNTLNIQGDISCGVRSLDGSRTLVCWGEVEGEVEAPPLEATATPTSTPAMATTTPVRPTASPTPSVTPTPTVVPEAGPITIPQNFINQCSNGIAVVFPFDNPDSVRDCAALLSAKAVLEGENADALDWSPYRRMTLWEGVDTERVGDPSLYKVRVSGLELANKGLSGQLAAQLGNLNTMRVLFLNNNSLTGGVPAQIGNLDLLRELRLNNNNLSGQIPRELDNMRRHLSVLRLAGNNFTGCLPRVLAGVADSDASQLNLPVCNGQ